MMMTVLFTVIIIITGKNTLPARNPFSRTVTPPLPSLSTEFVTIIIRTRGERYFSVKILNNSMIFSTQLSHMQIYNLIWLPTSSSYSCTLGAALQNIPTKSGGEPSAQLAGGSVETSSAEDGLSCSQPLARPGKPLCWCWWSLEPAVY